MQGRHVDPKTTREARHLKEAGLKFYTLSNFLCKEETHGLSQEHTVTFHIIFGVCPRIFPSYSPNFYV